MHGRGIGKGNKTKNLNVVDVLTVILNWQRPPGEGDQEVVKRSGRDEPVWVAILKCMEATLEIYLYSYFHLKLAKTLFFLLPLMLSLQ
jgi:hypothetical protein